MSLDSALIVNASRSGGECPLTGCNLSGRDTEVTPLAWPL